MSNIVYQASAEIASKFPTTANTVYQSVVETARNAVQYLYVTGSIGNNKIDTHVTAYRRFASLCNPGQKITLILDTSFPGIIVPGLLCVIYERGTKVLTGYVVKVTRERPSYEWTVDIEDEYTRVTNYFISEEMSSDSPQSAHYLIGQILEPTGISYRIVGDDVTVPPGTIVGLRSAHEALNDVMTYGSWYAWVDPDGILQIKKHVKKVPIVIRDPISVERNLSTEQTRNVVKIYGRMMEDGSSVNVSLEVNVPGLLTDLNTVVANPMISSYDDAERIGNYLLNELGSQTNILTFEVEGDPAIRIGTSGSLYYQDQVTGLITSGSGPVTSLESRIDQDGYIMSITIGERCPRISGWTADPRELRAVWIAARGGGFDPRPEKLIWTGDFGAGGQPTYNIVKTIPSGTIGAMHVTRNGRRVYLVTQTIESKTLAQIYTLWYSDNPYDRNPEWVRLCGSRDPVSAGDFIDVGYFNVGPFGSMQMIGNRLCVMMRASNNPGHYRFFYGEINGQDSAITWSSVVVGDVAINAVGTRGVFAFERYPTSIEFREPNSHFLGTLYWAIPNVSTFGIGLWNGVSQIASQRKTGSWWVNDYFSAGNPASFCLYADESGNNIRNRGLVIFTSTGKLSPGQLAIRGDYWQSQYQFVDTVGNLYVGYAGALYFKYRWGDSDTSNTGPGVVICTDKTYPNRLGWFPRNNVIFNEVARYSKDGGDTWANMTGNWWGTNSEVLAGDKMQSQGAYQLIDAHPTFWSSEAPIAEI